MITSSENHRLLHEQGIAPLLLTGAARADTAPGHPGQARS
ncbi:hypothetical protein ATL51_0005 [Pseudonocardia alni]|uniref:Uncharacterized protein n=1 Tax=Pseudonocardia alni TaxID=33907 RepID=A0A852W8K0_PSEA5|nr:hypothetical protein [Pseudonocardia antarctica]PKB41343.1 hypothetical protein ATL51_0005 [Pseudonocardia alni]